MAHALEDQTTPLTEKLAETRDLARAIVLSGIDYGEIGDERRDLESWLRAVCGHEGPRGLSDENVDRWTDYVIAAYAIGINFGLLLRPELVHP